MSRDINHLSPTLHDKAELWLKRCNEDGLNVRILQTWRTLEGQAKKFRCTRSFQEIIERADTLIERGRADLATVLMNVGPQRRPVWFPTGHLTMAACGESKHHKMKLLPYSEAHSYAFDFGCFDDAGHYIKDGQHPDYLKAGAIAESLDLEWLGNNERFPESAHIQEKGLPSTKYRLLAVVE